MNSFFAFIIGLIIGAVDWYLIYIMYKNLFFSKKRGLLFVFLVLKLFFFFGILYVFVRAFKQQVFFIILGLTVSLIGMIFILIRKNKDVC